MNSITELSRDEAFQLVLKRRNARRIFTVKNEEKKEMFKETKKFLSKIKKLNKDDLLLFLKEVGQNGELV
jgi:diadenosine tetraphosphate (Ap4A) HIT family hydrolase